MAAGVDLLDVFDEVDGRRAFNVVDALLEGDVLRGQHLDDGGLNKLRADIIRLRGKQETRAINHAPGSDVPSLYNGRLLQETDDGFGLAEAPLG